MSERREKYELGGVLEFHMNDLAALLAASDLLQVCGIRAEFKHCSIALCRWIHGRAFLRIHYPDRGRTLVPLSRPSDTVSHFPLVSNETRARNFDEQWAADAIDRLLRSNTRPLHLDLSRLGFRFVGRANAVQTEYSSFRIPRHV